MTAPVLVFDLETIPDVQGARRLHDFAGLDDAAVATAMLAMRRMQTGHEFLAHPLHRIVSIGVLYQNGEQLRLAALGRDQDDEAALLQQFFSVIETRTPTLVSWNGNGFDLPVLHYRALLHGIAAPRYWEQGDEDREFRYNNYQNRFHWRHIDVMDVLSGYQARATASLDMIATLSGFPGKLGVDGSKVWPLWQAGERTQVHDYVEHDVLNTYLVYLGFERMRGQLSVQAHAQCESQLRHFLQQSGAAHHHAFLEAWQGTGA